MRATPVETVVPASSAIAALLPGAYFHDAWAIAPDDANATALELFLKVSASTPGWVNTLMTLRNRVVAMLGLKNLGTLSGLDPAKPASAYRPGDRVGIFTLFANTPDEVLLGDKDKHLDVVVSVHRAVDAGNGKVLATVSTVVHVHNWLGRLYMLPVTPLHRMIAPAVLKGAARGLPAA
ncbi:DUF2867 domain-containing protein [Massilia sp. CCM 9210]|uniref:DUF2867 domain-containing protein n=1 Tax=Massilia scottii TaxID=3057166 RepID=UPI002796583A|nr:DUF2867 domain-containing protein [Massilia sp. CCM 9210]MDQ1814744.1 DUF2867 domain-containing protein [Massilia sp. CCM 9210]